MHLPPVLRLVAAALVTTLLVVGCAKRQRCTYCYDSGEIWLMWEDGRGARALSGLGGVQVLFAIPPSCSDPESWRPTKEAVAAELELMEKEHRVGFRPPANYNRQDYWTNLISYRDFLRKRGRTE